MKIRSFYGKFWSFVGYCVMFALGLMLSQLAVEAIQRDTIESQRIYVEPDGVYVEHGGKIYKHEVEFITHPLYEND